MFLCLEELGCHLQKYSKFCRTTRDWHCMCARSALWYSCIYSVPKTICLFSRLCELSTVNDRYVCSLSIAIYAAHRAERKIATWANKRKEQSPSSPQGYSPRINGAIQSGAVADIWTSSTFSQSMPTFLLPASRPCLFFFHRTFRRYSSSSGPKTSPCLF